jgi:hypothetical protein
LPVEHIALLAQRGLFADVVRPVQLGDILGDDDGLGILPGAFADPVAGIHSGLAVGTLGRKIGVPRLGAGARGLRQRLAMIIRAGETAEVGAIADSVGGDKKSHGGRLCLS